MNITSGVKKFLLGILLAHQHAFGVKKYLDES